MWHSIDPTHHHGRSYATGYTAQHTAQSHGAHSQEWPEPHLDPHTVGLGFGFGKDFDPAGIAFWTRGLENW